MTDRNAAFDEWLDDVYQPFQIGYLTFFASDILAECDPIAYRCAIADYESMIEEEVNA